MSTNELPHLNAILNSITIILLMSGYAFIKKRNRVVHKRLMLSAFSVSALFLTSYLIYHYTVGATRFVGVGWIRPVYFGILISHTVLAIIIVPPIFLLLYRALRQEYDKHVRLARWIFPMWLYVSGTGVAIYLMLYHLYPSV
jgi:putative membrane protein